MTSRSDLGFYSLLCFLILISFSQTLPAQEAGQEIALKHFIPELKYETADCFVASLNIMDFPEADNSGEEDMAPLIKKLLARLEGSKASDGGVGNGGVLFLPEGKYLLKSNITVPKGVTIRGEWKKPVKGQPILGTIIMTEFGHNDQTPEHALFLLEPGSGLKDLAFWYPRQDPDNIVPYPPTIGYGVPRYFGNEYCIARNVTFINSYDGAILLYGGGAPNMYGLYGTPLNRGVEIDFIAEVGRVEGADFSPDYWIGSGLPNAPSTRGNFKTWLRKNATGIVMRRIDWSFGTNLHVEGYGIGFHLRESAKDPNSAPNGQNFRIRLKDCKTGLYFNAGASVGTMFHDLQIENCDFGIYLADKARGVLLFSDTHIQAEKYALAAGMNGSAQVIFNQSVIDSGKIDVRSNSFAFTDSRFNTPNPQIKIGHDARVIMGGNQFTKKVGIINQSLFQCRFQGEPNPEPAKIPDFPYKTPDSYKQKPARCVLYPASDPTHGIKPNEPEEDQTEALQKLLNLAQSEGGGVVYLPPGKYRIDGHLIIPTGVELKGAMDIGSVPLGPGSVLEAYHGKGDPNAEPLITMQTRSGIRGIVINYPEQIYEEIQQDDQEEALPEPHVYPYAVRVAGKDVYLVNLAFRATYNAIDLFSQRCDNVYLEYPAGHVFKNAIKLGGGTKGAKICNAQFNTIAYACGQESKFGRWPNSPKKNNRGAYHQNWRDIDFLILEDCKDLYLFNNFHYASRRGTVFGESGGTPSGIAIGHGIDAAMRAFCFHRVGKEGFDLIGSQVVSVRNKAAAPEEETRFIYADENFDGTARLFNSAFWGSPFHAIESSGGTIRLDSSRFNNAGIQSFLTAKDGAGGTVKLKGASVNLPNNHKHVSEDHAENLFVEYSIFDPGTISPEDFAQFHANLNANPEMIFTNMLDRTNWTMTTSNGRPGEPALDQDRDTRWGTGRGMQVDDWVTLDLGQKTSLNTIFLDQGKSAGDFPKKYEITISEDGQKWSKPILTGEGKQDITVIRLPRMIQTRYIKITVREPKEHANIWWSIAEIHAAALKTTPAPAP